VLAAERGEADWQQQTLGLYWPQASAHTFAIQTEQPEMQAAVPIAAVG